MEGQVRVSDFGLLSAFGLRVSGLEHFDRPSVARSLRPLQRAGWTMLHAFFGHLLQTLLNRVIKRCSYLYIESTSNEGKAKRFAGQFRQLHANPADNAFAWLKDHAAGLNLLLKCPAFAFEASGFHFIYLRVMLQKAVARRAAIAVQTA